MAQAMANDRGKVEVEAAEDAGGVKKAEAETYGKMIKCYQSKCAEAPENKGMCKTREWALLDDLCLAEDLPEEIPDAAADGSEVKCRVLFGLENFVQNGTKTAPEKRARRNKKNREANLFAGRKMLRLGKGKRQKNHRRRKLTTRTGATIHDEASRGVATAPECGAGV